MKNRARIIWLTAFGIMVMMSYSNTLTFGVFCLVVFIAMGLVRVFSDPPAPRENVEPKEPANPADDDENIIRIRISDAARLRNMLLRHHNARGTDRDYQASSFAKDTNSAVQVLNDALTKKLPKAS